MDVIEAAKLAVSARIMFPRGIPATPCKRGVGGVMIIKNQSTLDFGYLLEAVCF
jgi:hypothetical protein